MSTDELVQDSRRQRFHTIHFILVVAEDDNRRWGLLEAFQQIDHFCLLFHILDHLENIKVRRPRTANIHQDRFHERLLGEILDLSWHRGGEEESLTLSLVGSKDGRSTQIKTVP